eukprot:IDg23913t1
MMLLDWVAFYDTNTAQNNSGQQHSIEAGCRVSIAVRPGPQQGGMYGWFQGAYANIGGLQTFSNDVKPVERYSDGCLIRRSSCAYVYFRCGRLQCIPIRSTGTERDSRTESRIICTARFAVADVKFYMRRQTSREEAPDPDAPCHQCCILRIRMKRGLTVVRARRVWERPNYSSSTSHACVRASLYCKGYRSASASLKNHRIAHAFATHRGVSDIYFHSSTAHATGLHALYPHRRAGIVYRDPQNRDGSGVFMSNAKRRGSPSIYANSVQCGSVRVPHSRSTQYNKQHNPQRDLRATGARAYSVELEAIEKQENAEPDVFQTRLDSDLGPGDLDHSPLGDARTLVLAVQLALGDAPRVAVETQAVLAVAADAAHAQSLFLHAPAVLEQNAEALHARRHIVQRTPDGRTLGIENGGHDLLRRGRRYGAAGQRECGDQRKAQCGAQRKSHGDRGQQQEAAGS